MTVTDPAKALARELSGFDRRLRSVERGSQASRRSLEVDGVSVPLPQIVENANEAFAQAQQAAQDAADASSAAFDAAIQATTALDSANGKNRVTYSTDLPSGDGTRAGDIWFRRDGYGLGIIVGQWEWTGSAWEARQLHDNVISTLTAGKITTGVLQAGTRIIAGPETGDHAELSSTGFRAFRSDQNGDGLPDESVRLGTGGSERLGVSKADGSLAASIDDTGHLTASGASFQNAPRIGQADHTGMGGTFYQILDRRPRGIEGRWGGQYTDSPAAVDPAGVGIFEIGVRLYEGRMYKIQTSPLRVDSTADNNLSEVRVHFTFGGLNGSSSPSAPSINSPVVARVQTIVNRANTDALIEGVTINKLFGLSGTGGWRDYRFLLSHAMWGTGNTAVKGGSGDVIELWIEDIGPYTSNLQQVNWGAGSSTVTPPPPPAAPPPQRYTRTWVCNWRQNWRGNNSFVDLGDAYQGPDPSGNNGIMKSYLGFSGGALETGQSMDAALAGATVEEVGIYLFFPHWYSYAGGSAAIGFHGFRTPAGAYGDGARWMIGVPGWRRNEGRWISMKQYLSQAELNKWATGTYKGIMLGDPGASSNEYYGRAYAEGSAQVNITYWR